ncbi:MAG: hypothetical protein OHK0053_36440 [Microscillaceae bacterium]
MAANAHPSTPKYLAQLKKLSEQYASKRGLAYYFLNKAAYHYFIQDLKEALVLAGQAHKKAEKLRIDTLLVEVYNAYGIIYLDLQLWDRSLVYFQKSLRLIERIRDKKRELSVRYNIALIYLNQKAMESFSRVIIMAERTKDVLRQATAYTNLGDCLAAQGRFTEAEQNHLKAVQLIVNTDNIFERINCIRHLSDFYLKTGDLPKALVYLQKAEDEMKKSQFLLLMPYLYASYADYYTQKGTYALADQYLTQALESEIAQQDFKFNLNLKELQYKLKKAQGNYQKANAYLEAIRVLEDSLFDVEKTNQFNRWEAIYQNELKEKENQNLRAEKAQQALTIKNQRLTNSITFSVLVVVLIITAIIFYSYYHSQRLRKKLAEQNEEISQINQQLQASNQLKNKLLSIIGHDLRGPISNIFQFVMLSKEQLLSQQESKTILDSLAKQSESTKNLLENVLFWAKSQMGGVKPTISQVEVQQLLEEIITLYQEAAIKKDVYFELKTSAQNKPLNTDREMLHLILRNLVHNALKYSPPRSTVSLEIEESPQGEQIIRVKDQGAGIPPDVQAQLLSSFVVSQTGTDNEKETGLGLMLVKEFVGYLHGQISLESPDQQGTNVEIRIPIAI